MPRTVDEILSQAEELVGRFENHKPGDTTDAAALRALRKAFRARADAERRLAEAVSAARKDGHSWAAIGAMVGTSGEAARQRYGHRFPGSGLTRELERERAADRAREDAP